MRHMPAPVRLIGLLLVPLPLPGLARLNENAYLPLLLNV